MAKVEVRSPNYSESLAIQTMTSTSGENSASPVPMRSPKPPHKQGQDYDLNRVHEELEKLNIATDVINKLELQLDEARNAFREIQTSWTQRLEQMAKKLGSCIEKSRPYYEAKLKARQAQEEAHKAVLRFERANSMHAVAKQQVSLTQESLDRQNPKDIDPACLEVLNHHVQRVNEAETERIQSEDEHRKVSHHVEDANNRVQFLERDLKRNIKKSRTYFDARVEFTRVLEEQKALIQRLEREIKQKKVDYTTSLNNLEEISEQIHLQRQLGQRESGVGSETPDPPKSVEEASRLSKSMSRGIEGSSAKSPLTLKFAESEQAPSAQMSPTARRAVENLARSPNGRRRFSDLLEVVEGGENLLPTPDSDRRERGLSAPPESIARMSKSVNEKANSKDYMETSEAEPRRFQRPASFGGMGGGLQSGVILLAQQLSQYGWFEEKERMRAFTFPPEQLDVAYITTPEGVKQFPTPPATPTNTATNAQSSVLMKKSATKIAPKTALSPVVSASPPKSAFGSGFSTENEDFSSSEAPTSARTSSGRDRASSDKLRVPDTASLDSFSDDKSSLASFSGNSIDDERLDQMLKSHRDLIEEIEVSAERAKAINARNGKLERTMEENPSFDRGSASGESSSGEK